MAGKSPRDYYEILGVSRDADADTVKKAYRKLAIQFHPDKNPGDASAEDKFKEASAAYEVLSNQEKRARYDRFGHAAFQGSGGGPQYQNVEDIFANFGDIFGDFFGGAFGGDPFSQGRSRGGRGRQTGPARGSDLRYRTEIRLEDVVHGLEKDIEFDTESNCGECNGSGAKKGTQASSCGTCGGSGQVVARQGIFSVATTCPSCRGAGQTIKDKCSSCSGRGRVSSHRKIRVTIPPGVDTGTQLRISAEGEGGFRGGAQGDLYVELVVKDHDRFHREGSHLYGEIQLSYLQAALGAEVEFESLDGDKTVRVPPGTQPGAQLRIEGGGIPILRGRGRGDLILAVSVEIPKKISKEEERLLRQLAEISGDSVLPAKKGLFGSV